MKQILLVILVFFSFFSKTLAQEGEKIVFHNTQNDEHFTLKRGDFIKVGFLEGAEEKRYKGTFKQVKEGKLYVKSKAIPVENIQNLSFRPRAMRWLFWGMLIVGALLLEVSFLSVFAEPAPVPARLAISGLLVMAASFAISAASLRCIERVNTDWTIEVWQSPPRLQPAPVP